MDKYVIKEMRRYNSSEESLKDNVVIQRVMTQASKKRC